MKRVLLLTVIAVIFGAVVLTAPACAGPRGGTGGNLGFSYLTITPGLADFYSLGLESGALVTDVVPGSQADRAGIRRDDIIVSFNGANVNEETPLFGRIRACRVGDRLTMEVWRDGTLLIKEMVHGED